VVGGQVLPTTGAVETIEIEHNPNDPQTADEPFYSRTPYYLAHHELFHLFQYEYINDFSLVVNQITYLFGAVAGNGDRTLVVDGRRAPTGPLAS
jgi:hypothetical protein